MNPGVESHPWSSAGPAEESTAPKRIMHVGQNFSFSRDGDVDASIAP
jgi:hypothetical protein